MSNDESRPPFVLPYADPVEEPPYYFGTKERPWIYCGLPLPTVDGAVDRICDRFLNDPLANCNEGVSFKPLHDTVSCSINLYQQAGSIPQPHEGWVEYLEITFMIAVRRQLDGEPHDLAAAFLPTLFLDGTKKTGSRSVIYAITGGREIFGLSKTEGAIKFEHNKGFHRLKKARLRVIDLPEGTKDPAPLSKQEILKVSALTAPPEPAERTGLSRLDFIARFLGVDTEDLDPERGLIPKLGNLRFDENQVFGGPLVGLKQFHDATDYSKASFQAVVESDFRLDRGQAESLYTAQLVRFRNSENVRLVDDLGLKVDENQEVRVESDDGVYLEGQATFGDPSATVVWECS